MRANRESTRPNWMRWTLLAGSAIASAALVMLLRERAAEAASTGSSWLAAPAPLAGLALAFPAVYMLWEQSDP